MDHTTPNDPPKPFTLTYPIAPPPSTRDHVPCQDKQRQQNHWEPSIRRSVAIRIALKDHWRHRPGDLRGFGAARYPLRKGHRSMIF